jgi:hypothetical protein
MSKATKPRTSREQLVDLLRPLLPKTWKLVPFSRGLDTPSQVTVMVHATAIRDAPAAPQGALETEFTLSVIDPQTDPERAQGALDDEVLELIHALKAVPFLIWESAEPTLVQDSLSWDIKTTVITRKDA